ncbi:unnamed protein product [Phaedon cochleariae]|uniref:Golgi apparatus membrane protein TVP23 homolog n=1 Tax=Phaedon cochleariae TaxID=80249 RepID=A0A9P0DUQ7_PHACE|nr:unnamed protein product [Phaedon cochleariae]
MSSVTMPLLDDDTVAFGEEENDISRKNALQHPYVTFFHLLFRGASIVVYMLCGWFSKSFIASFISVVLLLSMDFWTVKNISGRLMVGLRWWNYVDDEGASHWVFESKKDQSRISDREASIFWTSLVATPLLWSLFFIIALFSFELKWLLLVTIALVLNSSNLYGYIKCKVGNKNSFGTITSDFFRKQVIQNAVSIVSRQASTPQSNIPSQPTNIV